MRTKYFSGKYLKPLSPANLNLSPYKRRLAEQNSVIKLMKDVLAHNLETNVPHGTLATPTRVHENLS